MARTITLKGNAIKATNAALLVQLEDQEKPIWFPRSQICDDSEVYEEGHSGDLVVTEWIAQQKGLI